LADGWPERIVGYDLLLHLLNHVRLVSKPMKPVEYLAQQGVKRAAVQAVQILTPKIRIEVVDAGEYS
jgi:hypothetical protein